MFFNNNVNTSNNKYNKVIKTSYNVYDSGSLFLYITIFPILMSAFFVAVLQMIANFSNMSWQSFTELSSVKIINSFSFQIFFIIVFYLYNKKQNISTVKATSLKREISIKKVLVVLAMTLTTLLLISPIISLFDYLFTFINFNPSSQIPVPLNNVWQLLIALVSSAVLPAVVEELIFRGAILNGFRKKFSTNQAIIFSAILFTLLHGTLQQTVFQFILGIVLGLVFVVTGNLIYPIILHFFNNAIVLLVTYFYSSAGTGSAAPVVYDSVMSVLSPILLFVIGLLIVAVLLIFLTSKPKQHIKDIFKAKKFKLNSIYAKQDNIILIANHGSSEAGVQSAGAKTEIVVEEPTEKKGFKSLTDKEIFMLILGVSISAIIWLSTTMSIILGV